MPQLKMTKTRSVLIVEDDQLVRESLLEVIGLEGCDVELAANAQEGLQKISEKHFDLAFMDLRLPDSTGIELLKEAKKRAPELEVIIMTGFGTVETAVEA